MEMSFPSHKKIPWASKKYRGGRRLFALAIIIMRFAKIFGVSLITLGIALLTLQVTWMASGQIRPQPVDKKAAHDYTRSPYPGIVGVALIAGGIGFLFTVRREDGPPSRRPMR